jgi:multiple sugar transport system substrate-binding protein
MYIPAHFRTLLRWTLPVVLVMFLLAACGPAAAPLKPVTIRFAYATADGPTMQPLAAQYQKDHPNVTIQLLPKEQRDLDQVDPQEVDVFVNSNFSLTDLRKNSAILNVDPWMEGDRNFNRADFLPGSMDLFTEANKTWAIPAGIDPYVMYYNQDLFDKRGVAHPADGWQWEDFLQTALKVTDANTNVYGFVSRGMVDPALFVYQHGGKLVNDWQNPTRATFDDPKAIEALEWWSALSATHKVAPPLHLTGMDTGGRAEQGIFEGRIGMWTGQLSERGGMSWPEQSRWPMKWGMAPLPQDAQPATIATGEGYYISAKATSPDDCWQWISYLSGHATGRLAPARKSVLASNEYAQGAGADVAKTARTALAQVMLIRSLENSALARAAAPFQTVISDVSAGTATVREAMSKAQKEASQATP